MSNPLFGDDSGEEDTGLKTNKDFAKSYNKYRQKELLKKLKDKDGGNESDSSSDLDSSDDDEVAYNPKFDEEFLKTLSSLKRKDSAIYERTTKFFEEENILKKPSNLADKKDEKRLTIKQYEQENLLKYGGVFENDEETGAQSKRPESPTLNEEQKMIKNEFKTVLNSDVSDEGGDFGGLFTKRQKTKTEEEEDNKEQERWLAEHEERKSENIDAIWSGSRLSKDDKFLRDYILSNGYTDKQEDEIPTYDEIVADDDFEEKQTEFEHKYNFRYEDPDQEFIKRYPRTVVSSVRKVDNRRKEKRTEYAERKEREKKEKFNEIEIMKELKRKEIEEKIAQLKAVTGTDKNIEEIDLDNDFDPEEYDNKMNKIFNSEYYQVDEGDEKPECPSDIEDLKVENYDEYEPEHGDDQHCEDGDFNMDCDYEKTGVDQKKSFQDEIIESTRRRKSRKRKSKFTEALEHKKPVFDPSNKTFDEYLDEYYRLDCEDIIGDVKCRFKYVETVPCDYGLSVEEILLAKNKELNAWASLKKATQIRPEHVERNDQAIFERKARNEMLKRKILLSLYEPSDDDDQAEVKEANKPLEMMKDSTKKSVGEKGAVQKKKKNKAHAASKTSDQTTNRTLKRKTSGESEKDTKLSQPTNKTPISNPTTTTIKEKKLTNSTKKKHIPLNQNSNNVNGATKKFNDNHKKSEDLKRVAHKTIDKKKSSNGISDERLKAFGINPKKFAKKKMYGQKTAPQAGSTKQNSKNVQKAKLDSKLRNKLKKALKA